MDYNYVENLIREDIKNKCPQLTNEIIEEYLDLTFFRSSWVTYGDNKDIYLVGIAEGKYDFYYVGFDDNQNLELISCALDIKPNKKRDNDFIPKFNRDFQSWCDEGDRIWKIYRDKIKNYFEKHPQEKLIYFQDRVCSDEHIIYDNKEKTKYHIEEL